MENPNVNTTILNKSDLDPQIVMYRLQPPIPVSIALVTLSYKYNCVSSLVHLIPIRAETITLGGSLLYVYMVASSTPEGHRCSSLLRGVKGWSRWLPLVGFHPPYVYILNIIQIVRG